MRVLVSGSRGLIGRALTGQLTADGHEVVTLARGPGNAAALHWDPAEASIDRAGLAKRGPFDAVVHLAGAPIADHRWNPARRLEIRSSRVMGTSLLVGALRELVPTPSVLVSASAVGFYGDRAEEKLTEASSAGSGFLPEVCTAWEGATAPAAAAGMRVVTLRTGVVLSARGGALGTQLRLFRLGLGGRLGNGRQYLSWITLADQVAVIRRAIDDESLQGPVNGCTPNPVTNAEFSRTLGRIVRRPAVLAVPAPALSAVFGPQMARELLLASQRAFPTSLEKVQHPFNHPELEGALDAVLARSA